MEDKIMLRKDSTTANVILNHPEAYNAFDSSMLNKLRTVIAQVSEDDTIRVVLIRSTLDKSFISGADIAHMQEQSMEETKHFIELGCDVFDAIESCPKPVVAVINGYCLGGGLELALACDLRIASNNAKFGFPEVKLGILPGWGGLLRAPRIIGPSKTMEFIFTGRMFDAKEAKEIGLVNSVCKPEELEAYSNEMAKTIAANAPLPIRLSKKWVPILSSAPKESHKSIFTHATLDCFQSEDRTEGICAFLQKRRPHFRGK